MKPVAVLILISFLAGSVLLSAEDKKKEKKQSQTQTQPQTQTEPTVTYEILKEGTSSGVREPITKVVTTRKDWEEFWKKHVSMIVPQPPVPDIDFESQVVAVVFLGEKQSSGYRVLLKDVSFKGADVVVTYKEVQPPASSFTLQVITQPFLMVKVQKPTAGSVQIVKE